MTALKRFLCSVPILLSALFLSACAESEPIVVYDLKLSESSIVFDCSGGQKSISAIPFPETEEWTAVCKPAPEWFEFDIDAQSLTVTAQPNTTTEVRTATIVLSSIGDKFAPKNLIISQEAAEPLSLSTSLPESVEYDSEGGEQIYSVVCNYEWKVECSEEWLEAECDYQRGVLILTAEKNLYEVGREARLKLTAGEGEQLQELEVTVAQSTRAENPYYNLVGKWQITATKWFYSTNGSLNELTYSPSASDYYLIFDIVEAEYGKTLRMENFLYPGTALEVNYDEESGGFVIPFGWTVLGYDVFLYVTFVSSKQFSYGACEVAAKPTPDGYSLQLNMPEDASASYVGFGLWTYGDNGVKVAVGSNYRPTLFPMGTITLTRYAVQ